MPDMSAPSSNDHAAPGAPAPHPADQALLLDQQLCFALYSSTLLMTKLYKPHLDALGLTYPQYLLMLALWEQDDQVVNQLGARLGLDSGTLTPLLRRMEGHGWIVRQRDERDERRVRVRLTPEGQGLKLRAREVPTAMRCLIGGSDDEMASLRSALHELRHRLGEGAEGGTDDGKAKASGR
mgnify:FL=1